jgi:hypothetical protein
MGNEKEYQICLLLASIGINDFKTNAHTHNSKTLGVS